MDVRLTWSRHGSSGRLGLVGALCDGWHRGGSLGELGLGLEMNQTCRQLRVDLKAAAIRTKHRRTERGKMIQGDLNLSFRYRSLVLTLRAWMIGFKRSIPLCNSLFFLSFGFELLASCQLWSSFWKVNKVHFYRPNHQQISAFLE